MEYILSMDSDKHPLAEARRSKSQTQTELGKELYKLLSQSGRIPTEYSEATLQKRVSLWETGRLQPSRDEIWALAKHFDKSVEAIELWFERRSTSSEELFKGLAESERPSFIGVCFGGFPALHIDSAAHAALVSALGRHTRLAMFYPYPSELAPISAEDSDEIAEIDSLRLAYSEIRLAVERRFESYYAQLAPLNRGNNIALYLPRPARANFAVAPQYRLFTYVLEFLGETQLRASGYVWVESKDKGAELFRVGSYAGIDPLPQMDAWKAYFGRAMQDWIRSGGQVLPGTRSSPDVGRWVRKFSKQELIATDSTAG
jgi:transcriptional regulator with XRE-family HTH domain